MIINFAFVSLIHPYLILSCIFHRSLMIVSALILSFIPVGFLECFGNLGYLSVGWSMGRSLVIILGDLFIVVIILLLFNFPSLHPSSPPSSSPSSPPTPSLNPPTSTSQSSSATKQQFNLSAQVKTPRIVPYLLSVQHQVLIVD